MYTDIKQISNSIKPGVKGKGWAAEAQGIFWE